MVAQGLLPEIRHFYDNFKTLAHHQDYTKGVLQTIGFKEFIPYLDKFTEAEDAKQSEAAAQQLQSCLEELKLVTRRYSKKQIKWIKNRLLAPIDRQVPPMYSLDTTEPREWEDRVYKLAEELVEKYMVGNEAEASLKPMEKVVTAKTGLNDEVSMHCESCNRVFVGEYQWNLHLASNKHKKVLAGLKKKTKRDLKRLK